MAFHLKASEKVRNGVKRIILRQMDDVLAILREVSPQDSSAVHDIRVHLKKIRACLRLSLSVLSTQEYDKWNIYFRDAGHPLTKVRDAEVLIETLDKLGVSNVPDIRKALLARYESIHHHILQEEQTFKALSRNLEEARVSFKDLPAKRKPGKKILRNELYRSYRRNRDGFQEARRHPTAEKLHEWRKQAKYLWYQLLILERAFPHKVKAWDNRLHKLTQTLGNDHDLIVLRKALTDHPDTFEGNNIDALLTSISENRRKLRNTAFKLGDRLYHDKPRAFADKIEKHWEKWSKSGK